jgi:hypothetical protein
LELIRDTIIDNPNVKIMVAYERSLVDLFKLCFYDSLIELKRWKYGKQNYILYQIILHPERSILLLSTPFFGQGQTSYDGIADCVQLIEKAYLTLNN